MSTNTLLSFIQHKNAVCVGGEEDRTWRRCHTQFVQRYADTHEHATLLCSLLTGFGLAAYVCTGSVWKRD